MLTPRQVIGAPSFFPTVWGWIKRWFDPITTSKIFILNEEKTYRTLSTFIDPANIPKKYGGNLDWEFGMRPVLDPAEEQHIVWASPDPISSNQKWPLGPVKWIPQKDGTLLAMAVGSVDGKERREVIATFHPDGKENRVQSTAQSEPKQPEVQPIQAEAHSAQIAAQPVPIDAQSLQPEALPVQSLSIDSEKIHQPQPIQTPAVSVTNGTAQKLLPPQSPAEVTTLVNGIA